VAKSKGWNIVKMLLLVLGSLCVGFYVLNVVSPNTSEKYVKPLQLKVFHFHGTLTGKTTTQTKTFTPVLYSKFRTGLEAIGLEKLYAQLAQSVHEKCGAIKDGIGSAVTATKQALFLGGPSSAEEPRPWQRGGARAIGSAANEESASPPNVSSDANEELASPSAEDDEASPPVVSSAANEELASPPVVSSAANEELASPPAEDDEEDEAVETDNVDTENT
jgi:hypothetical protein